GNLNAQQLADQMGLNYSR
ncbi:hypothetical protein HaLaN_32409, partial [Haematococcus lacustris]